MLLDQFLAQTRCNCQVINLGAGFDSLFWLLKVTVTAIQFIEWLLRKNKFKIQGFRFFISIQYLDSQVHVI